MTDSFKKIYNDLQTFGLETAPRGMPVLELENYSYELQPYERFANYPSRKLNIDYIKRELRWYLKGDQTDLSIADHAAIWKRCITNGIINSNYGHYIFKRPGMFYIVEELTRDKDSRRAVINILNASHMFEGNNDVPCTVYMGFRIRNNKLNMSVRMRSQDAIYGMGNDVPFFSIIHEMVFVYLLEVYPELELGAYHHVSDSFHVYARHFEMLSHIIDEDVVVIECPRIASVYEIDAVKRANYACGEFSSWLNGGVR